MLVQGLLLVAVIVLISGSIITSTLVTAKAALSHSITAQAHTAMSDATADFVAWAQARVRASNAHASWSPKTVSGKPDTTEFRPLCSASRVASATDPECKHAESISWIVTGTTDGAPPAADSGGKYDGAFAENMSRPVDEQRISAVISVDVDSMNGRQTFASMSREVTARVFDAAPYVVITGMREASANNGSISTGQGDSGGRMGQYINKTKQTPDPREPYRYTETRITASVNCENTPDVNSSDPAHPYPGKVAQILEAGRDGDMDWQFQTPCVPTYPTPQPPPDPRYVAPYSTLYSSVEGNRSTNWSGGHRQQVSFPR